MRILDEVTRDGEDDHPPVGEIALDRLHTTVLARIEGPEPRHSPALAAAVLIATRGMARDRQPVVALTARQIKKRAPLGGRSVGGKEGIAQVQRVDEVVTAARSRDRRGAAGKEPAIAPATKLLGHEAHLPRCPLS